MFFYEGLGQTTTCGAKFSERLKCKPSFLNIWVVTVTNTEPNANGPHGGEPAVALENSLETKYLLYDNAFEQNCSTCMIKIEGMHVKPHRGKNGGNKIQFLVAQVDVAPEYLTSLPVITTIAFD